MTLGCHCPASRLRVAVPAGGGAALPVTPHGEPELQHARSCSRRPAEPQRRRLDGEAWAEGGRVPQWCRLEHTAYPQGQEVPSIVLFGVVGVELLL